MEKKLEKTIERDSHINKTFIRKVQIQNNSKIDFKNKKQYFKLNSIIKQIIQRSRNSLITSKIQY